MSLSLQASERPRIPCICKAALPVKCCLRQRHSRCKAQRVAPRCSSSNDNGRTAEASSQQSREQSSQSDQPPRIPQGLTFNPVTPPEQEGDIGALELRRETFAGRVAILTLGVSQV